MKKVIYFSTLILCFCLTSFVSAEPGGSVDLKSSGNIDLRILLAAGYTHVGNDLSATYGPGAAAGMDRLPLNAGLGFQVLSSVTENISLGVEMNFHHWIRETDSKGIHPIAQNNVDYCYHTLNMLAVMEFKLSKLFILQTGFGLAVALGPNNKYGGSTPYFMIAPGVDIPIGKGVSIPILARIATVGLAPGGYGYGNGNGNGLSSLVSTSLNTGITLKY